MVTLGITAVGGQGREGGGGGRSKEGGGGWRNRCSQTCQGGCVQLVWLWVHMSVQEKSNN